MSTIRVIGNTLPLSYFIRRQKVLSLYRKFYRLTRNLESEQQRIDLRRWVRDEFRSKMKTNDNELIEIYLTNGQNAFRDLENSLRHAHAFKH
ncbi:hypothetical protein RDWZM_010134 [Blomia tropicalis]|uniref:Complex 1 LYR protein domain-containing protein n=1 Tax=Blomia tropicalis TaxID=40697 RepID=A0A9Q0RIE1_BLOTA|nr:hypothetical protein RDWZM_010134 [Blomia tropicalis]